MTARRLTCYKCDCVFEYDRKDLHEDQREPKPWVYCPCCNSAIDVEYWNDSEGHEPEAIVALDRDKETAIGKMIWSDIKKAMDAALTNTVRMEINYLVYFDEEESHD